MMTLQVIEAAGSYECEHQPKLRDRRIGKKYSGDASGGQTVPKSDGPGLVEDCFHIKKCDYKWPVKSDKERTEAFRE